ncbi:hypothetical protein FB45DRAFT_873336 [Roridomyces roridus]|uniref:F-box domain-containing protein n=1 Tax=Roridomyces roridus TaxID=1738132 RepID=A0AAD7BB43_9AGAR|nr:hypothetical protein FB45DRAFT_873336 [Roridomyces roridus]
MSSPLDITELLDHIIDFLDSSANLRACALVQRSWVHLAQSRIFASVNFTPQNEDFGRLLAALDTSPHLVASISTLSVDRVNIARAPADFHRISALGYTCLTHLVLFALPSISTPQIFSSIKTLVGTQSLTSVLLDGTFLTPAQSFDVWDGCSTNIRRLAYAPPRAAAAFNASNCNPAQLTKKVKLDSIFYVGPVWWFNHPSSQFDVSSLRALKWFGGAELPGDILHAARNSLECLSVNVLPTPHSPVDLSPFRHLKRLEICASLTCPSLPNLCKTIQFIAAQSHATLEVLRFSIDVEWTVSALSAGAEGSGDTDAGICALVEFGRRIEDELQLDAGGKSAKFAVLRRVDVSMPIPAPALVKGCGEYFPGMSLNKEGGVFTAATAAVSSRPSSSANNLLPYQSSDPDCVPKITIPGAYTTKHGSEAIL